MNFSEYVAIFSGNTELLEKARIEKKVAALESERKAFGRNKAQSEYRLKDITDTINGNNEKAVRMKRDLELFNSRVRYDREGNRVNPLKLDGINSTDVKVIAAKLAHINATTNTQGDHYRIGELYGFRLLVRTENSLKDGTLLKQNHFSIEGESNIRYTFNNGSIA